MAADEATWTGMAKETIDGPAVRNRQRRVVPRELATAMTGIEFLEKLRDGALPAPPFAEVTDIWITEVERGRVVFEAKPSPRFYNPLGSVHGGWIATVLDSAMGCAVHSIMHA